MNCNSSEKSSESSASDLAYGLGLRLASQLLNTPRHTSGAVQGEELLIPLTPGCLIEISGRRSSGRFAVGVAALAAAHARRENAALIDLGDHLDPQAAQDAGVELARLLWVRPVRLREALLSAEMAAQAGFPLVVLDLGTRPLSWRGVGAASFLRLARAAEAHEAVVLVISPQAVCGPAASAAAVLERSQPVWHGQGRTPRLLTGISAEASVRQRRKTPSSARLSLGLRP